jgi:spermidine synthase
LFFQKNYKYYYFFAGSLIFFSGFFGLIGQGLLFRLFLTLFEGNELSIGVFFATWLIWVAMGALSTKKLGGLGKTSITLKKLKTLFYLFFPLYIGQYLLVFNARFLAGLESYHYFPFFKMLIILSLANAPMSFLMGSIFALAAKYLAQMKMKKTENKITHSVSTIYICEALGAFFGGVLLTCMFYLGWQPGRIFLSAFLIVVTSIMILNLLAGVKAKFEMGVLGGLIGLSLIILFFKLDDQLTVYMNKLSLTRVIAKAEYKGSFATHNKLYLLSNYENSLLISDWGGVIEAYPQKRLTQDLLAMHLAQSTKIKRILIVGNAGLSLAELCLAQPEIKRVFWLSEDPRYAGKLIKQLGKEDLLNDDGRFNIPRQDVRAFLKEKKKSFDLIILNISMPNTARSNRFFTKEFFRIIKQALNAEGLMSLRFFGGENYLGQEIVQMGATIKATLEAVFSTVSLKPGEDSWFFAADKLQLPRDTKDLQNNLSSYQFHKEYPLSRIEQLFLRDRLIFQNNLYRREMQKIRKISTDKQPFLFLKQMLLIGKVWGEKYPFLLQIFYKQGLVLFYLPLLVLVMARILNKMRYIQQKNKREYLARFDLQLITFTVGFMGISLQILLMFVFQTYFGSLFLYIGIISALFMMGLSFCSQLARVIIEKLEMSRWFMCGTILLSAGVVSGQVIILPYASKFIFILLFVFAGSLTGFYYPLIAYQFQKEIGFADEEENNSNKLNISLEQLGNYGLDTAAKLEIADHLGAALGALMVGILFLPVIGVQQSFFWLACLVLLNLISFLPWKRQKKQTQDHKHSWLSYLVISCFIALIICAISCV